MTSNRSRIFHFSNKEKMMTADSRATLFPAILLLSFILLSSCTRSITLSLLGPALEDMRQQSDVALVCEGTPPYLLMIDSFIAGEPSNTALLEFGIKGYSGYAAALDECGSTKQRMSALTGKAYLYGKKLLMEEFDLTGNEDFETFSAAVDRITKEDVSSLFWAAFGWSIWIQQQQGAPAAMAVLGKVEKMLQKIIELDEGYQSGTAHFLLGAYYGSRSAMLGGEPESSKYHFERALMLSERKMLIFQTVYAETYARATLDKDLHDSLLNEVSQFSLDSYPQNTLSNQIAKNRASRLLQDGFFDE